MKTTQNNYFNRFDKLFDDIYENISNGWSSFPVDDFHVAVIVYQRILLECMDNDNEVNEFDEASGNSGNSGNSGSLSSIEKLKQIKLWVTGYVS